MVISGRVVNFFYEPLPNLHGKLDYSQEDLIGACVESWHRMGFTTRRLTINSIRYTRLCHQFRLAIARLPTVNPSKYEQACFLRWLAMAQNGGGLMIDYDVINCGLHEITVADRGLSVLQGSCPSVVWGDADDYFMAVKKFIQFTYSGCGRIVACDRPHASDQTMIENCFTEDDVNKLQSVLPYTPDLSSGPYLVHCATQCTTLCGINRLEAMRSLIPHGDS